MLTVENFDFSKLNRTPKEIFKEAIKIHRQKYPGQALNRNSLCEIVSWNLEKSYLPKKPDDLFYDYDILEESEEDIVVNSETDTEDLDDVTDDVEGLEDDSIEGVDTKDKKKKEYNGEHLLKKMGLNKTKVISRKIDFYIYKHYFPKK